MIIMSLPNLNKGIFSCFGLRTRVSLELQKVTKLGPAVYATTYSPFEIDEWWQRQLGELEIAEVDKCSLFLIAFSDDLSINVLDLTKLVNFHYLSLILQGVGYSVQGVTLSGENSAKGMRVSGMGVLEDYHRPPKMIPAFIAAEHLNATACIVGGLYSLFPYIESDNYLRLRKGLNAFIDGVKHAQYHSRLHQFVRSIDGVIKPKKGEGTNKFKYRCGFFAGRTPQHVELLEDLYELRSAAEHLNPLDDRLIRFQTHEREKMKALRTYQSELLASFVYRKILSTPTLLSNFIDDAAIDLMWGQSASQLIGLWGNTINLHTAPTGLFHDYL
jgi:hypothetical protein